MTASLRKHRILVINDDRSLLESRRMLLEDCGAHVFTARGEAEAVRETLIDPVDLILIDVTNAGVEHDEDLCALVKAVDPVHCVALFVTPEMAVPANTKADHVIHRTGPRQI